MQRTLAKAGASQALLPLPSLDCGSPARLGTAGLASQTDRRTWTRMGPSKTNGQTGRWTMLSGARSHMGQRGLHNTHRHTYKLPAPMAPPPPACQTECVRVCASTLCTSEGARRGEGRTREMDTTYLAKRAGHVRPCGVVTLTRASLDDAKHGPCSWSPLSGRMAN